MSIAASERNSCNASYIEIDLGNAAFKDIAQVWPGIQIPEALSAIVLE
jgi:hypothetical protein